jgi:serine/threonine-protein kinase HipA
MAVMWNDVLDKQFIAMRLPETKLVRALDRPVSIIKRFDRREGDRVHFASALTMLGMKEGDRGTYEDIAFVIRQHSAAPKQDIEELFKRAVFNVMASNFDDHLRNHAFLYARDKKWSLSSAYDMNPIPAEESTRELATWLTEDVGAEASVDGLLAASVKFGLVLDDAKSTVKTIASIVTGWRSVGRRLGLSPKELDQYESAFSHGEIGKALKLHPTSPVISMPDLEIKDRR